MDSREEQTCAQNDEQLRKNAIRMLNDELRQCRSGGQLMVTQGICNLGKYVMPKVIEEVCKFNHFHEHNDRYGEHDFGALRVAGNNINWKIDYYDLDMKYRSPDPADPDVTIRVLTIMLASEY